MIGDKSPIFYWLEEKRENATPDMLLCLELIEYLLTLSIQFEEGDALFLLDIEDVAGDIQNIVGVDVKQMMS